MKPQICFRALEPSDWADFMREVGYYPTAQFGGIVAYSDNGVMGMVGFDRWTATGVEMHWYIARPRCIMPLWRESLAYLASHGKLKIIGNTPGDNVRALRMIFGRLGFKEIGRVKDGYDTGIDLVISEYAINEQEHAGADPAEGSGRDSSEVLSAEGWEEPNFARTASAGW